MLVFLDTPSTPGTLSLIHTNKETKLTWEPPVYPGLDGTRGTSYKISKREKDGDWEEWTTVHGTDFVIEKQFILEGQNFKITPMRLCGAGDSLDTVIHKKGNGKLFPVAV